MADEQNPVQPQVQTPDAGGHNSGTPAPQQQPTPTAAAPVVDQDPSWLKDRLDRAERSAVSKLLDGLGVTSADDLKGALQRVRDIEDQQKTAAEKLTAQLDAEKKARETAEQQVQAMREQQQQAAIDSAIRAAATAARAEVPDDVIMRARDAHTDKVAALLKDGKVDEAGVKALIDAIKGERPKWFIGTGPGSPSNNNGSTPEPDAAVKQADRIDAERRARQRF